MAELVINSQDLRILETNQKQNSIVIENLQTVLTPDELNNISKSIEDGGKLELNTTLTDESLNELMSNLKLAGFLKVEKADGRLKGVKKNWGKKNNNPWKSIKIEDSKNDLVLEHELIDPFDNYQKFAKASDCITKPKPCKNCNCGRAERENVTNVTPVDPNFKPDCGKCYLGDAFRCAGCPYRGKPAFEPGDKIQFSSTNLDDNNIEVENTSVNVKEKKVKLDL
jgi:hypothetical protein